MPNDSQFDDQNDGFDGGAEGAPENDSESKPPLYQTDKNQKIAAASLAVFAVLILILWSVQLKNNIYGPLSSNLAGTQESALAGNETAGDSALKNKDTDADGLSDYDELNIYNTSPYLADSDSDGLSDGQEVNGGTNPNCPVGRTCAMSELEGGADSGSGALATPELQRGEPASSAEILNNLSNQSQALNSLLNQFGAENPAANGQAGSLTDEQKQALKGIDAASLRQLLLTAGMPKETLDQISDAELMRSYNETLQ